MALKGRAGCVAAVVTLCTAAASSPAAGTRAAGPKSQAAAISATTNLVSPRVRLQVVRLEHRASTREGVRPRLIPVEITSTRDLRAELLRAGAMVEADIGGQVLSARVPVAQVDRIARIPGVREVFASDRMRESLDTSVPEIRAPEAWALRDGAGLPVRGAHVLVGVVDSGIDLSNADFRTPDGTTRIRAVWDQLGKGTPPAGFTFGAECSGALIQDGGCGEKDVDGHGTHVTGIAAGNGRSGNPAREIGVAPDADIVVVKTDFTEDKILAAWQYLVGKATQLGEPIVINCSFGTQLSPHDGTEPEDLALDALGGAGRVFVTAAGNEGNKGLHAGLTVGQAQTASATISSRGRTDELTVAGFYSPADALTATLTDTVTGQTFGPVMQGQDIIDQANKDGTETVTLDGRDPDSRHHGLYLDIRSSNGDLSGRWTLSLRGTSVADAGRFDAWIDDGNGGSQSFGQPDESDTIAEPADAAGAIAVANYATRVEWQGTGNQTQRVCDWYACKGGTLAVGDIKQSSSIGPTADMRQKPDIAAPGTMIISSLSRDAVVCSGKQSDGCIPPQMITPDGRNLVESGTSMSAPHVTGVVALMLQVDPLLDPSAAARILRTTARHDSFTGQAPWSPTFGAGKVDAQAAVIAAMAERPSPTPTATATPSPTPVAPSPTPAPAPRPSGITVLAVRVDRHPDKNSWRLATHSSRFKPGGTLALSIFSQVRNVTGQSSISVSWSLRHAGKVAFERTLRRAPRQGAVVWDRASFAPPAAGRYRFVGTIQAGTLKASKSVAFWISG